MPIYIYSAEAFPGPNNKFEYVQVLGHQIILEAGRWTKLPTRFERPYWTDFKHRGEFSTNKAVSYAQRDVHVNDEVAAEIILRYGFRGVTQMDEDPETHRIPASKLEAAAIAQNRKWREHIISRFENERKMRHMTGHGRLEPTSYELECYSVLGLPEPGSLDEIRAEKGLDKPVAPAALTPELMDLIQEAMEARAAKKAAELANSQAMAAGAISSPVAPAIMTEAELEQATRPSAK